jgi:ubiquinol-cytochrome c reductase iron-sulfur subunit
MSVTDNPEAPPTPGQPAEEEPGWKAYYDFDDPRLEPAARDPRKTEKVVGACFVISILAFIALAWTYWVGGQVQFEGFFLMLGIGGIGVGLVSWGKYLMPRGPFEEERDRLVATEEEREAFRATFGRGAIAIERRGFLVKLAGAAVGLFGLLTLFPLRSLGPKPGNILFTTNWKKGSKLVMADGHPVHVDDLEVGGVTTVFPEGYNTQDRYTAVDQTLLIRASSEPIGLHPDWAPHGYLAFSKVCTHAGCPVSLYEEEAQRLLCPCHQSVFEILQGAQPVFGPAPRPLPALPLYVDSDGILRAQRGYNEPIGPGFWERA